MKNSKRFLALLLSTATVITMSTASMGAARMRPQAATSNVQLKVFMTFPRFQKQISDYFKQFKAKELKEKHINADIKLEMPNSDQANAILKARLASSDAPDLYTIQANSDIPTYYKAGYIADLSKQPFVKSIYSSVKKTVMYNGKVMALPIESVEWGYLYNKSLFSKAGVTPPQTLSAMKTVISKLKAKNITPFELAFQESWVPQLMTALSLGGVVTSERPNWVQNMNNGKGSYSQVKDIFNIIDLIMQNGTDKPFEVSCATGASDFANGKAAMWIQGTWEADAILQSNPKFQLGCAPLPVNNSIKGTLINLSTTTAMVAYSKINTYSKAKQTAAYDLLNYMLDKKDSSKLFENLKFNPVASFMKYKSYPWTSEAMAYVSKGRAYQDLVIPNSVTSEQAVDLQKYYSKSITKAAMISDLDSTYKKAVQTAG